MENFTLYVKFTIIGIFLGLGYEFGTHLFKYANKFIGM